MSPELLLREFDVVADAPGGVQRLRELILQLAVRGKLVPQDPADEPASVLLERIEAEKKRLYSEGRIGKPRKLPAINPAEAAFPVPRGWEWVRLGALADHRLGKMLDKRTNSGELYPYLRNTNVQWLRFDLNDVKEIRLRPEELDEFRVSPGDLLVCEGGEPGRCAIWEDRERQIFFQKAIHRVRPYLGVEPWYLLYCLQADALSGDLSSYFTGATIKHMTGQALARYVVPLAPFAQQQRIVEKVNRLMALCNDLEERQRRRMQNRDRLNRSALYHLTSAADDGELTHHWARIRESFDLRYDAPETVAELRQAVLQLAIRGKLVPQDPNDERASVLLERIKEEKQQVYAEGKIRKPKKLPPITADEVPFEVPEGWEWARVGQATKIVQYGYTASADHKISDVRLLRITDIQNGRVEWSSVPGCEIAPKDVAKYELQHGDLLIARTGGTIGKSYLVSHPPAKSIFASYLIRLTPADGLNPRFLLSFAGSPLYWEQLIARSAGTGQPNVNGTALSELAVPLPPIPEQRRIVTKVNQLMALCDELEVNLTRARTKSEHLAASFVHHLTAA